jgi:photosystem II stability/assembly factor-like uncharacterized protein
MRSFARYLAPITVLVLAACTQPAASPSPSASSFTPSPTASPVASPTATPSAAPFPTGATAAGVVRPTVVPMPSGAQISAPSSNVAWVTVGGVVLFRSTDRGGSWEQRPLPPSQLRPDGISFTSDVDGWIVGFGSPATQCQVQSIQLWRTTDAGSTYQLLPGKGIADQDCKESLSFVDAQRGFLGSWRRGASSRIYRTVDGGDTWAASAPLPDAPGITAGADAAVRVGAVRAFGSMLLVEVRTSATVQSRAAFVSRDDGASWSVHASVPGDGAFAFVTATRWITVSTPGQSQETTDAGATWHPYSTDYQQAAPVAPVLCFADASVGYATVRGSVQRTTDGGAHWTPFRTPGT